MADEKHYNEIGVTLVTYLLGVLLSNIMRAVGVSQWMLAAVLLVGILYYAWRANEAEAKVREDDRAWDAYRDRVFKYPKDTE